MSAPPPPSTASSTASNTPPNLQSPTSSSSSRLPIVMPVFRGMGFPSCHGHLHFFRLVQPIPFHIATPTTMIVSVDSKTLIKVGVTQPDAIAGNFNLKRMYDTMLPYYRRQSQVVYIDPVFTYLMLQMTPETTIRVIRDDYISFHSPSVFASEWTDAGVDVNQISVSITGFHQYGGVFSPHYQVNMVEVVREDDHDDEDYAFTDEEDKENR